MELQPVPAVADGRGARARLGADAGHRHDTARRRGLGAATRCASAGRSRPAEIEHDVPPGPDHWGWNWSDVKSALEWLFWTGEVTTAGRNSSFARLYDLTERVLPAEVLPDPTPSRAGRDPGAGPSRRPRSLGVAAEIELRDYFRLTGRTASARPWPNWWRRGRCARSRWRAGSRRPTCYAEANIPRRVVGGHADQPVRPADLGAQPDRAAVRLPLPHRDLHRRLPSGCTATTCCRSCSAIGWWPGSTSRPTARPACCWCRAPGSSRAAAPARWPSGLAPVPCGELAGWLGLDDDRRARQRRPGRRPHQRPRRHPRRTARDQALPYERDLTRSSTAARRRKPSPGSASRPTSTGLSLIRGSSAASRRFDIRAAQQAVPVRPSCIRADAAVGRPGGDRGLLRRCRVLRVGQQPDRRRRGRPADLPGQAHHRVRLPGLRRHPCVLLPACTATCPRRPATTRSRSSRPRSWSGCTSPGRSSTSPAGQCRCRGSAAKTVSRVPRRVGGLHGGAQPAVGPVHISTSRMRCGERGCRR